MKKGHLLQEKLKQAQKSMEESWEIFPHTAVVAVRNTAGHMDQGCTPSTHWYHFSVTAVLERSKLESKKTFLLFIFCFYILFVYLLIKSMRQGRSYYQDNPLLRVLNTSVFRTLPHRTVKIFGLSCFL